MRRGRYSAEVSICAGQSTNRFCCGLSAAGLNSDHRQPEH